MFLWYIHVMTCYICSSSLVVSVRVSISRGRDVDEQGKHGFHVVIVTTFKRINSNWMWISAPSMRMPIR